VRAATARTPVWVKAILAVLGLGLPAWGLAVRHDRITNEHRLNAIATEIVGRPVKVRCPGPIRRIGPDTTSGVVHLDQHGRVPDETRLSTATCAELDALAEGRRERQLACAERSTSCGDDVQGLAWAVNTVGHEAFHLRGVLDEGVAECYAMQTLAQTAQRLGATPEQAQNLAVLHFETSPSQKPSQYQAPGCANGDRLDLRPGDAVWP
jgi:hypothetical protein